MPHVGGKRVDAARHVVICAAIALVLVPAACTPRVDSGDAGDRDVRIVEIEPPAAPSGIAPAPPLSSALPPTRRVDPRRHLVIGCDSAAAGILERTGLAEIAAGSEMVLAVWRGQHAQLLAGLHSGAADLVLTTFPTSHAERRDGLAARLLLQIPLVVVVHSENRLATLSRARLGDVLSGVERSWFNLSQQSAEIELVGFADDDPLQVAAMQRLFPGRTLRARTVVTSVEAAAAAVASGTNAIALLPGIVASTARIRQVPIDREYASAYSTGAGRYPLVLGLWAVTSERSNLEVLRLVSRLTGLAARERLQGIGYPP